MNSTRYLQKAADSDNCVYWRCRRGMLELDLLLQGFYKSDYKGLCVQEKQIFLRLLDYPDGILYELLLGGTISTDEEINRVIKQIRAVATH